jgi:hypothetical protein
MGHFSGYFEGGLDFCVPKIVPSAARDNLEGQKSLGPLKISLKMAQKVVCPHFQNQRYIVIVNVISSEPQADGRD